jgi:predicted flap endonuclease-1-like 5' DNA nuclease
MWTVAQDNLILIVIALLIGLAVALWAFRRSGTEANLTSDRRADGPEGNGLQDEFAAATQDVAGEILGVDAHPAVPAASGPPDNLRLLKGVGPKMAAQLNEFGIVRFDQLAGLTETEVALLDRRMGAFEGRIARDRLVEQARYLERGDKDGFEAKFGKLGAA